MHEPPKNQWPDPLDMKGILATGESARAKVALEAAALMVEGYEREQERKTPGSPHTSPFARRAYRQACLVIGREPMASEQERGEVKVWSWEDHVDPRFTRREDGGRVWVNYGLSSDDCPLYVHLLQEDEPRAGSHAAFMEISDRKVRITIELLPEE